MVVPEGKLIEEEFQRFIGTWLLNNLHGGFARAYYNEPSDLRDYAYEHSKIMALKGNVLFDNWPPSCGSQPDSSLCDWNFYKTNRAYFIKQEHSIDFTDVGYPLQSKTGGRGFCVDSIDEWYGYSAYYSPNSLLADLRKRNPAAFPNDGQFITAPGPHFYGVGVYTSAGQGGTAFWLTVIRVSLTKAPPCNCALTVCSASP